VFEDAAAEEGIVACKQVNAEGSGLLDLLVDKK
jgi:hypothetical protein